MSSSKKPDVICDADADTSVDSVIADIDRDTLEDPESDGWPGIATMPFARGEVADSPARIRLDSSPPLAASARPQVGHRYLNYEIRRRLARGSMGLVYEANHLHLRRRVAIKFLSPTLLTNENMVYRFLGEAQAMARIEHSGIPTIFDFGQDAAGNAYLIMEYLEGESLAAKLERAPLPFNIVLEIAAQTAEILAAAHAENIVHRDLKPENILLCDDELETPNGPLPIVRLIDFGICKARCADERVETAKGNLIGTPRYMAPEQTYSREVSPKTDVYALGCVIYELLAGRPVFDGKLADLVDAHRHRVPADLRQFAAEAPAELAELVALMLAKEPGARPSSGFVLASALRSCKVEQASGQTTVHTNRRRSLPTPRASTARAALEDGMLSAERTPLPFRRVTPAEIERRLPTFAPTDLTTTTEVSIASRAHWLVLGFLTALAFGIGIAALAL